MTKEDIYTTKVINDYSTNILTPLGQKLWDKAEQSQRTMLLDVKIIEYQGFNVEFQYISRALFGNYSAPGTYEVKIIPTKLTKAKNSINKILDALLS
tara:strand:+ start:10022 stop:10312 length:291 start_codon:yes stop_codon:yes gene_type:complete